MELEQIIKETEYTQQQQIYYMACLKEMDCVEFVKTLCMVAYYMGVDDSRNVNADSM